MSMNPALFEVLFKIWKEKELKFQRKGKRQYLHFDPRINFHENIQFFQSYLAHSEINVARHSFYPLIKSDIVSLRIRTEKDENGKRKLVRKTKSRPISYASHFDSFLYSWYCTVLNEYYQNNLLRWGIEECVLAYVERNASNIEFANEVFEFIRSRKDCVALAFDVSSFFDGLDHQILKKMWCKVLNVERLPADHFAVYKSLTNYTFAEKGIVETIFPFFPTRLNKRRDKYCELFEFRLYIREAGFIEKNSFINRIDESKRFGFQCGIPQGSPISACLSNIYMIDFDQIINNYIKVNGGLYRRYCDDIIVVCDVGKEDEVELMINSVIKQFELLINKDKTEITYFKLNDRGNLRGFKKNGLYKSLQYLGFEFNGKNIYIRSSSMSRYARKLNEAVQKAVNDAYNQKFTQGSRIFRKKLYRRFSDCGKQNFISYAERAALEVMKSDSIHRQYKNSIAKIEKSIAQKITEKEIRMMKKGNPFKVMK